ncbi:MAG TPA: aminopeptidase N [Verrucomicrobiae bacterium]|nr:aminopeptidase N [Verrucomicrobiae bacterium]
MDPPAASAANLTREEARERSTLVAEIRYAVELDLTPGGAGDPDHFLSSSTVRFRCTRPGATSFLDFAPGEICELTLNGRRLAPPSAGHRVTLPDLASENLVRVVGRCPFRTDGVGLHRFRDPADGLIYCYTHFEPFDAHRVFACFDQPDCKAELTLGVRAPSTWSVIANSALAEQPVADGDATWWRFRPTPPISAYVSAVVAGPFHSLAAEHHGLPLGLHCRRSLAPYLDPDELLAVTREGLDYFPQLFGHPYPFDRYDQVFVPEFNAGAMENAGCVTVAEGYLFRGRVTDLERENRADTLLHEMAHMWFGDLVTMRWWDDLWLNESFATLLALLACTRATRFRDRWLDFVSVTHALARQADQRPTSHPIVAEVPDVETVHLNFDPITYEKGCAVLRQLLALLGDAAFAAGLQRYVARHRFASATLRDFLQALGEASGRDLTPWSALWLETSGVATLRIATRPAAEGRPAEVVLEQDRGASPGPLLPHLLAVGAYVEVDGELRLGRRTVVEIAGARTPIPDLGGPPPALLLPNDGALTYAKLRLDPDSLATARERLAEVADPLARTLIWETLRDMLRDAELSMGAYLGWVERHAPREAHPRVLAPLLRNLVVALERFSAPRHAAAHRRRGARLARSVLAASPPGGDLQLGWARVAIVLSGGSGDEQGRLWLEGLLDQHQQLPGTPLDVDLRWMLVARLAALGVAGADRRVAAELDRDATDIGQRRAAAALAGRPTAEAKAAAWAAVTRDPPGPVATLRATLRGFQQSEQSSWLAPYVDRYLTALEPIWQSRDLETALTFASEAFPRHVVSQELSDRLDAVLGGAGLAPPLRRILVEGQDDVRRALRARACDAAGGGVGV